MERRDSTKTFTLSFRGDECREPRSFCVVKSPLNCHRLYVSVSGHTIPSCTHIGFESPPFIDAAVNEARFQFVFSLLASLRIRPVVDPDDEVGLGVCGQQRGHLEVICVFDLRNGKLKARNSVNKKVMRISSRTSVSIEGSRMKPHACCHVRQCRLSLARKISRTEKGQPNRYNLVATTWGNHE